MDLEYIRGCSFWIETHWVKFLLIDCIVKQFENCNIY
uniref:Uncharacterized protein n=1 Tax=Nelumbo nucifera TaxID=4432 RepID=A0A822XL98_NELNU|nr:TPA_asm: hypothetical protein HUJ06_021302 [Nelumbo nucifera]